MSVTQTEFRRALLDPAAAAPDGLRDPLGRPAGKRFDVYRNNVAVSLTEALETGFPVISKLLGERNFKGVAGIYLRRHPPSSPLMMHYGAEMPSFLAGFAPLAHLPYLADVARLELALRRAYHAADASPADPAAFSAIPPEELADTRLSLAPAVAALASPWPILGIWRRNTDPDAPKPAMQAEEVLVVRPEFDPEILPLPPGGAAFVNALERGSTIGEAAETAASTPGFDLAGTLSALFSGGAITKIEGLK